MPGLAMPVACQMRREARGTPIAGGRHAADQPASLGRTRLGLRGEAQQENRDALALRPQHQAARGDEIEHFGMARNLDDHRAQGGAAQGVGAGAQRVFGMGGAQQEKRRGIDPPFGEAGGADLAMLERREILADPEQPPRPAYALGEAQDKAGGRGAGVAGEDLVQGAAREAAAQACVGAGMAEGTAAQRPAFPQNGVEKLAGAGQFLRESGHMFPICSKVAKTRTQSQSVPQPADFKDVQEAAGRGPRRQTVRKPSALYFTSLGSISSKSSARQSPSDRC